MTKKAQVEKVLRKRRSPRPPWGAPAIVIGTTLVVALWAAVDEKSWWHWAWGAVSTGFAETDRYMVDWRLFLSVVACGIGGARWLASGK